MAGTAPAGRFARATTVTPAGEGRWTAAVEPGWDVAGNAHGGVLLAIATRALAAATDRPDPVTITAHYLRPVATGPLEVATTVIRRGRALATASATVTQEGTPRVHAVATMGTAEADPEVLLAEGAPPDLPPVEVCHHMVPVPGAAPSFTEKVDLRLHPDDAGFMRGEPTGRARMRGWLRLADGEAMDGVALTMATDALPPTVFNLDLPVGWTPTVELTAHVRARPVEGWLRTEFRTCFVSGGRLEADGLLWDERGVLVAQSRQLALVPRRGW